MFLAEVLGELFAIEFVEVLAGVGELIGAANHQRVIGIVDDAFEGGHSHGIDDCGYMVAYEEQTGLGVIDDIMDLFGIELMQDGYGNGTVGERGQECNSPLRGVAATKGNFVATLDAAVLEENMDFLDLTGYIMELQGLSLVVCERITIPIVNDAFLYECIKTWYLFHISSSDISSV